MAAGTKTVATLVELGGWLIGQWVWDNKTYWEAVGHSLSPVLFIFMSMGDGFILGYWTGIGFITFYTCTFGLAT